MKIQKWRNTSGMSGLLALAIFISSAAGASDSGWYTGGSAGLSHAEVDEKRITSGLLGGGFATTSLSEDEFAPGFKLFGGYQFNKYFALENGYFEHRKFGFTATTVPAGSLTGIMRFRGVNFDVVGILPITDNFSAFGRAGVIYSEAKGSFNGTGAVVVTDPNRRKRGVSYKFGVGVEYAFTDWFSLRTEAERYRMDDAVGNHGDIDLFSSGVVFRFGGEAPPVASRVETPRRSVAAPVPAPRPPAVTQKRVTFSANTLFDFDKATLRPEGKQALDAFVSELADADVYIITVTGHTDRLGSQAYNQALSQRRAATVKAYLVETTTIPARQITTRGLGESEPVTQPDECVGNQRTARLIACLQPDRRVEIEVTGTKE